MTAKHRFPIVIDARFASAYLVISLIFFAIFGLLQFDRKTRHTILPNIPMSSQITVLAIDDQSIDKFGPWPWSRETIGEILNKVLDSNPDRLGVDVLFQKNLQPSASLQKALDDPRTVVAKQVAFKGGDALEVMSSAKSVGFANFEVDNDGVVRNSITKFGNDYSLARKMQDKNNMPESFLLNVNTQLPRTISLAKMWDNPELKVFLEGRKVLIGAALISLGDNHTVPNFGLIPGVMLHALALNQMLAENYPQTSTLTLSDEVLMLGIVAIFAAWVVQLFRWRRYYFGFALSFIFLVSYFRIGLEPIFSLNFIVTNILSFFTVGVISYVISTYLARNKLHKTLGLYLPAKVLKMINKKPEMINLGGESKDITVFFSDIRNFTKMTEKFGNTAEFGSFLNEILELQTKRIERHEGVVDKFIGDAVMAFWGAPVSTQKDAYLAVLSACDIILALKRFNQRKGLNLQIGFGISSGQAIVGNFGSKKRFNYTAIGDVVNTSSRLESLNKNYSSQILLSHFTVQNLSPEEKDSFKLIEIDKVYPKGKLESVTLYTVQSFKDPETDAWVELLPELEKEFPEALDLYYKGEFEKTLGKLSGSSSSFAQVIKVRCQDFIQSPPQNWDGVWTFQSK